jgi:hypothetical protein
MVGLKLCSEVILVNDPVRRKGSSEGREGRGHPDDEAAAASKPGPQDLSYPKTNITKLFIVVTLVIS